MPQQQMPQQQMPQQQQQNNTKDTSGIDGFFSNEMGGSFSDMYSFIDGNKTIENSYEFINGGGSKEDNNNQQPIQFSQENKTNKSNLMDKAYEDMMKQRGSEMTQSMGQMRV